MSSSPPLEGGSSLAVERSTPARRAPRARRRWAGVVFWLLALGVLGANVWWLYEDYRPVPDLDRIGSLMSLGRHEEAEGDLRALLRRSPEDGAALMMLARALGARGRLVESAETLGRVPFWWPAKRVARFLEGEAYSQAGLARRAESAWLECVREDPLHPTPERHYLTAVESLIEIYANQERFEDARAVAWRCFDEVAPDLRQNVVFMLLRTYVQRIAAKPRVAKLSRYVAADPLDVVSRLALARAEFAVGNREEAERQARIALEGSPGSVQAYRDRLWMLKERGELAAMGKLVAELPAGSEKDGDTWGYRGVAAEAANDLEAAYGCYAREVELKPLDEEALYRLALIERRTRRVEEAEKHLARSKELRAARGQMLGAYQDYSNAIVSESPDPKAVAEAREKLAAICRTLGLDRLASVL